MDDTDADAPARPESPRRHVEVPMAVYKVVVVFSMLIAVGFVIAGFLVVDRATNRGFAPADEVSVPTALAGVALIVLGAAVYVFSTRFRAEGMENAKDDTDEPSDNG